MAQTEPLSSENLLSLCQHPTLDAIQLSTASTRGWLEQLTECIDSLDPADLNAKNKAGNTALGLLTSYRPPVELQPLIEASIVKLTAAGANPLAGDMPALVQGNLFVDSPGRTAMLSALVDAQRQGKPFRPDQGGGNVLHAMLDRNIGTLMQVVKDSMTEFEGAADVLAQWRDETNDEGYTPVDLAWDQYPSHNRPTVEGETAVLWSLLKPGRNGVWQPPPLDMQCLDGQLLYEKILCKLNWNLSVPPNAEPVLDQVKAFASRKSLDDSTHEVVNSGSSPRQRRF